MPHNSSYFIRAGAAKYIQHSSVILAPQEQLRVLSLQRSLTVLSRFS